MKILVLWLYFATPWNWNGLPMSSGWASTAVLDPPACHEALERVRQVAVCLEPGATPGPLARVAR